MKTMLDKCAVAGDITQAIDRRGAWSCAVTVIGGTENTAVKLQSADSADGEFTDFKTLISADEAETDQYKGFVLDLSGAGNFIKIVGATMATCVLGDCDHDVKEVAIKAGEIPSGADLEDNKTATIDVSTYTEPVEIEPTEGKDGMKKATVTLSNIPSGGDVTAYAWIYREGASSEYLVYFPTSVSPIDKADYLEKCALLCRVNNQGKIVINSDASPDFEYTRVNDTVFKASMNIGSQTLEITYVRDASSDFTLWKTA